MKTLLTTLLIIPSLCQADPILDRELVFDGLMAIDYGQTRYIFQSRGRYYERNPLIHKGSIGQYFLSATILHAAITYTLPEKYQKVWQWSTIAVEGAVVGHNAYIGIGIKW